MSGGADGREALPDVGEVLAHGGWLVLDPRPAATAHPETFEMPTPDELAALGPGHVVRVMVALADIADEVRDGLPPYDAGGTPHVVVTVERLWLTVVEVEAGSVRALLDNEPWASHTRLRLGAELVVPLSHLIATGTTSDGPEASLESAREVAELLAPPPAAALAEPVGATVAPRVHPAQQEVCDRHDVLPHRPSVFARCLVARDLDDTVTPVHGVRFDPRPERGDCGWVIWALDDDMAAAEARAGFEVLTVQELQRRRPGLWGYLALPATWGFTLAGDGGGAYEIVVGE